MKLEVKLFAVAKEAAGRDVLIVEIEPGATVADLRTALIKQIPALKGAMDHVRFAVNQDYADERMPLLPDSEIACIPPVSGG